MASDIVLPVGTVVLALVVVWEVIQSRRIDGLQKRIDALEKKTPA
jgi:hypothetical protein